MDTCNVFFLFLPYTMYFYKQDKQILIIVVLCKLLIMCIY